jgi:hypothetical protein
MHSAILVVKYPAAGDPDAQRQKWQAFLSSVNPEASPIDPKKWDRLGENVWLVNFQKHPQVLARLVDAAVRNGLPYGILPLDAEPQWLPASTDPKTILDRSGV